MEHTGRMWSGLRSLLPTGSALPQESWRSRHLVLFSLLVLHIPAIGLYGLATEHSAGHSLLEASLVGAFALAAMVRGLNYRVRAALTTVGLVTASAVLVHLSNGLIEMHFHFFIMVALVTLYQDWLPFLLAIGYVVLHHGSMGLIDVSSVFNHPDAMRYPWKWAFFHGLFIAGQSAACLAAWKVNEIGMERERAARRDLEKAIGDLAEAQAMSSIGSWEWDITNDSLVWSDELYRIAGVSPSRFQPSYEAFIQLIHESDRDRIKEIIETAFVTGEDFNYETTLVPNVGDSKTVEATGLVTRNDRGEVVRMAGTLQDVSMRRTLEEQVEYQAFHDSLTGLANRALFLDRVEHALIRRHRHASPIAVLFVDLDDFKSVNDSLGHRGGDDLLIAVADRIRIALREIDTVSRLGGDEFAVLLEDLETEDEAVAVAKRILDLLTEPVDIEGHPVAVRATLGIAFASSDEPMTPGELLRNADTAMYVRKHSGKDGYSLFEQQMQDAASERLALKADLQRAIDREEFVVHYQPIVDLESGAISSLEALVRWDSPERGLVAPLDFIPFAEETGLIVPISRLVLVEACYRAAGWQARGPLGVAVNVSAVSIREPSFTHEVADILASSGLPPECLTLEITESVLVQDDETAMVRLRELKTLGVKLAIDDFGTGYSSLSYLRKFPTDELKIDKSFIDSISVGPEESALARAIIKLGQTLDMKVVAEGVEEMDQAQVLKGLACNFAQGYLYSKPIEAAEVEALLSSRGSATAAPPSDDRSQPAPAT